MMYEPILNAAATLAAKDGFANLTRLRVATRAKAAVGTVNYHFKTMDRLRGAVLDHAVEHQLLDVLAKAWAEGLLARRVLPSALIRSIIAHIMKQ
jgi:AcrR family transcriptional regulator